MIMSLFFAVGGNYVLVAYYHPDHTVVVNSLLIWDGMRQCVCLAAQLIK